MSGSLPPGDQAKEPDRTQLAGVSCDANPDKPWRAARLDYSRTGDAFWCRGSQVALFLSRAWRGSARGRAEKMRAFFTLRAARLWYPPAGATTKPPALGHSDAQGALARQQVRTELAR